MAAFSSNRFWLGFAAHVAHAVMLANGRRLVCLAPARQPAFAGVVTGSFVDEQVRSASSALDTYRVGVHAHIRWRIGDLLARCPSFSAERSGAWRFGGAPAR